MILSEQYEYSIDHDNDMKYQLGVYITKNLVIYFLLEGIYLHMMMHERQQG